MAHNCGPVGDRSTEQNAAACGAAVLLGVNAVARLLDCSVRHIHRLRDGGKMPQPVRLGSLVKWRRTEIEQWVASGCPSCRRSSR